MFQSAFFSLHERFGFDFSMFENIKILPKGQLRICFYGSLTSHGFLGLGKYKLESYDNSPFVYAEATAKLFSCRGTYIISQLYLAFTDVTRP